SRGRRDDGPQTCLTFHTPGEIETPNRYRNRYGQLLEHAPFSQRDFHGPAELDTHREPGEHELIVGVRGAPQRASPSTPTCSTSSAGMATSTPTRSRSTTSSPSRAGCTSRRPRTRRS